MRPPAKTSGVKKADSAAAMTTAQMPIRSYNRPRMRSAITPQPVAKASNTGTRAGLTMPDRSM